MIPQESGIRTGGSLNEKLTQKDLGNLLKVPNEESWGGLDIFQREFIHVNFIQEIHWGKREKQ